MTIEEAFKEIKLRMDKKQIAHLKKCEECRNGSWNVYADAFGDVEKILDSFFKKEVSKTYKGKG